jgi:hypothetical protein
MLPSTREDTIEVLAGQLADLMSTQAADLREYARATMVGAGTMQLERNLRSLELRRTELYHQFEEAAFSSPPVPTVCIQQA